jgi:hypothetical protein
VLHTQVMRDCHFLGTPLRAHYMLVATLLTGNTKRVCSPLPPLSSPHPLSVPVARL